MTSFSVVGVTIDLVFSWLRMVIALIVSIAFSLMVGILAARNRRAEAIIIPVLDVFQSIPILGFFPIVILAIIALFPSQVGVNIAVIMLIFTSMSWNIAFGVYEAVKSIPLDYLDLFHVGKASTLQRIISLYVPASVSRIAYNTQISWLVGIFYLISSEILTLGSQTYAVNRGIGVAIMQYATANDWAGYAYAVIALVIAAVVWQFIFLRRFALWSERYKFVEEPRETKKDPLLRFYSWINDKSIAKLFLMKQSRGVSRFTTTRRGIARLVPAGGGVVRLTSSISKFRTGLKYSALILFLIFISFEIPALVRAGGFEFAFLPPLHVILSVEGSALVALLFSFARLWYVYFICVATGLPLGIVIALNEKLLNTVTSVLDVIASVPAPALLPLVVILVLGNGEAAAAIVIYLGMMWYIIFNVMAGIRTIPKELFELRSVFHISRSQAWTTLYLPAAAAAFVTGSITAIGAGWNTLIVAEYFSVAGGAPLTQVGTGIGKLIVVATNQGDLLTLTMAVLTMTAFIVAFNLAIWRRVYHFTTKRYSYNR
jgi:NitT/TauT family transport system permease protein